MKQPHQFSKPNNNPSLSPSLRERGIGIISLVCLVLVLGLGFPNVGYAQSGKKYAVLVGVSEYQHDKLKKLRYTENDASELADVLK
jgi:hypothetical protein